MADPETNLELTIEKLVYGGEGLARAEGRVVFVPYALPGERVLVEPATQKGGLLRAAVREVSSPPRPRRAALPLLRPLRRMPLPACRLRAATGSQACRFCARRCGAWEDRGAGGDRDDLGRAMGISQPGAISRHGSADRISGSALPQALPDHPLPYLIAALNEALAALTDDDAGFALADISALHRSVHQ